MVTPMGTDLMSGRTPVERRTPFGNFNTVRGISYEAIIGIGFFARDLPVGDGMLSIDDGRFEVGDPRSVFNLSVMFVRDFRPFLIVALVTGGPVPPGPLVVHEFCGAHQAERLLGIAEHTLDVMYNA